MSNKCLVTRLKAAIQNDDLPLFDTIKLQATERSSSNTNVFRLGVRTNEDGVIIKVDGNGYFANAYADLSDETKRMTETTVIQQSTTTTKCFYFKSGVYNVYIQNAHNLRHIGLEGPSSSNRNFFRLDLTELKNNPGITTLQASQSNVYGNIGDIPSTITDLMVTNTPTVYGNIRDIASKSVFTRVWISNTLVTGSIEDFVAGQISQGAETSDWIMVGGFGNLLTFGGIIRNVKISGLSWDGADKIYGADNRDYSAATTIYAKGATAEKIAQWESDGKTVVVITDDGE